MRITSIDRLLLPAIFGLSTIVVALVLWQLLVGHRIVEIQAAARAQASFVKTKTESELRARVLPLERLAGRSQDRSPSDEKDIESDASLMMSGYPAYRSIEWADPALRVVWAEPEKGNEADIGADLGRIPGLRATFEHADQSRSTMVASRVDLGRGG